MCRVSFRNDREDDEETDLVLGETCGLRFDEEKKRDGLGLEEKKRDEGESVLILLLFFVFIVFARLSRIELIRRYEGDDVNNTPKG